MCFFNHFDNYIKLSINFVIKYNIINIGTKTESEYDQEIPQSHTAGQPMVLWGRAREQ